MIFKNKKRYIVYAVKYLESGKEKVQVELGRTIAKSQAKAIKQVLSREPMKLKVKNNEYICYFAKEYEE